MNSRTVSNCGQCENSVRKGDGLFCAQRKWGVRYHAAVAIALAAPRDVRMVDGRLIAVPLTRRPQLATMRYAPALHQ
jgi:hypothetical protein